MHLTLVVSDCPPPGDDAPEAPALPVLASVLRVADRRPLHEGWRAALARRLVPAQAASMSLGSIAAAALPAAKGQSAWLATPLHLQATPDHLRLPAGGLPLLDDEEAQRLATDFARVFAGSGLSLLPARGRFVLAGLPAARIAEEGGADPSERLGSRLDALSGGSVERRRLASEIELWLHEHPLNVARAAARRPSIDALWLWGGAPLGPETAAAAVAAPSPTLYGDDAFIDGLAALGGAVARTLPAAGDAIPGARDAVVQVSLSGASPAARRSLDTIEREWLQPLLQRLRRGELETLELWIATVSARITRRAFLRFWRSRQPWWEYLRR